MGSKMTFGKKKKKLLPVKVTTMDAELEFNVEVGEWGAIWRNYLRFILNYVFVF